MTAFPLVLLSALAKVRKSLTVAYRSDHRFGVPAGLYDYLARIYGAHFDHFHSDVNVKHDVEGHSTGFAGVQPHCFLRVMPTEGAREKADLDLAVIDSLNKLVLTPLADSGKERKASLKIVAREFAEKFKMKITPLLEDQLDLFFPSEGSVDMNVLKNHLREKGAVVSSTDLRDSLKRINRVARYVDAPFLGKIQVRKSN